MSPFAAFETDMIRHEKFERIPAKMRPAAFAIHVAFILHCAEQLTDGRVLRGNATEICRFLGLSRPRKTLVSMEEVGLLSSDKRAFYVHDYAHFQPTKAEVEQRRKRDAQRKRDARLGRNVQTDILTDAGGLSERTSAVVHTHTPLSSSPSSSTSPQDTYIPTPTLPAAAADFENELTNTLHELGWRPFQIGRARQDPARARAWAETANAKANGNPGGYAWAGFDSGDWPTEPTDQENPKMDVVEACQRFIESIAWDETFDDRAMAEEFRRIERRPTTAGDLDQDTITGLLEQWKATRQDRYGIPANLSSTQ